MDRSVSQWSWSWCVIGTRSMVGLRVDSGTLVLDIGNEATLVISSVGDNLNTSIWQSYTIFTRHNSILILDFFLGKVCSGIGILNG